MAILIWCNFLVILHFCFPVTSLFDDNSVNVNILSTTKEDKLCCNAAQIAFLMGTMLVVILLAMYFLFVLQQRRCMAIQRASIGELNERPTETTSAAEIKDQEVVKADSNSSQETTRELSQISEESWNFYERCDHKERERENFTRRGKCGKATTPRKPLP